MSILTFTHVSHTYGSGPTTVHALRNVSLSVDAGEFVALMGPSGAGKSTLLRLGAGLEAATEGQVSVDGHDLGRMNATQTAQLRRTSVGVVFQQYNLIPSLTVVENVGLPLELDGQSTRGAAEVARTALERVGISDLAPRRLDQISGGEQQRVAIARAIVGQRRLVLADEPTGALDSVTSDEIFALLRDLADDGLALLVVTHEPRLAGWADRVLTLGDGELTQVGA